MVPTYALCIHVKIVWISVRLLAVRSGPDTGTELASVNLFPIMDYLAQCGTVVCYCRWRSSVLTQLDVPCFVQTQRRAASF